jgi:hypothetical protein
MASTVIWTADRVNAMTGFLIQSAEYSDKEIVLLSYGDTAGVVGKEGKGNETRRREKLGKRNGTNRKGGQGNVHCV